MRRVWAAGIALWLGAACTEEAGAPDTGRTERGVYANAYFGFELRAPERWTFAPESTRRALEARGAAVASQGSMKARAALDRELRASHALVTLSRYPIGAAVPSNPLLHVVAERLSPASNVASAHDVLLHVGDALAASRVPYRTLGSARAAEIGGQSFARQDAEILLPGRTLRQTYYATLARGYALTFSLSYTSQDELDALMRVISSVRFD